MRERCVKYIITRATDGSAFTHPTGEFDKTRLANPITLKSYRQRELSSDMMVNKNEKEFKV